MTVHSRQRTDRLRNLDMSKELDEWKAKCAGKSHYTSRNQAKIKARELSERKGLDITEYRCPFCRAYHIGKTPKRRWREIT